MRFVDTTIFVRWGQATPNEALQNEEISTCGYILNKIQRDEKAQTSSLVKDEALIWFSRYRASRLVDFVKSLVALTNLQIINPSLEDEFQASKLRDQFPLGISDLINLSVMNRYGVREIYSTDKGFDKISSIKRIFDELRDEAGYGDFMELLRERTSR
jgi:predicted nucleic acid-binding protein